MADDLVFKPIEKRKVTNEFDRLVIDATNWITEAGTNYNERAKAINKLCASLAKFDDVSKTEIAFAHITKNTTIKKNVLQNTLKRVMQDLQLDEKQGNEVLPEITRVENFITKNYDIRFNEIALTYECKHYSEEKYGELNVNNIWRNMQKHHINYHPGKIVNLIKSDFTPKVNPIEDYFKNLPEWDGTDRIDQLCDYITVSEMDKERFRRHMKKMFVRVISSALGIAFNKHALILVHSGQSSGKSTFLRWLCPKALQSYYIEDVNTDKDGLIALSQNVFINLDDFDKLSSAAFNNIKSFMSKDWIKVRIPYDRNPSLVKRCSSFFGSTNEMDFLNDPTGSVRWICFQMIGESPIKWTYKKDFDINEIWSQAYYLFKKGFEYQLTRQELHENEKANLNFIERTTEMDLIQRHYVPSNQEEGLFLTTSDMITRLNALTDNAFKLNSRTLGRALSFLGFLKATEYSSEYRFSVKGYYVKPINEKN